MTKNHIFFILIFCFFSCSTNSTDEVEPDNQTEEEVAEEQEEMQEEEEIFTFPFGVSVLFKEYSNSGDREGEFTVIDFIEGASSSSASLNLTQVLGLDLDAGILENGQDNILVFVQKSGTINQEYLIHNLDTQLTYSANRAELLIPSDNCFFSGSHIGANQENLWAFNYDLCPEVDGLALFTRNYESNSNSDILNVSSGYTGDSSLRIWATNEYLYVHFNSFNIENLEDFVSDGLYVYDAKKLELVYQTRTPENKIPAVDGNKIVLRKNSGMIELYDLELRESLFLNSISIFEGPFFGGKINNASIFGNKVVGLMLENNGTQANPGVYDFATNTVTIFNTSVYEEFFRTTGLPTPNPARLPQKFLFDLESETFVVLYHGLNGSGSFGDPDFTGIVFMNFEGEILYEQEFLGSPSIPQLLIRR